MELFSSFVNVPIEFLPEEARAIHAECKGSPMVISMIGSLVWLQHRMEFSFQYVFPPSTDERGWTDRSIPKANSEMGVLSTEPPLQTIQ